MTTNFSLHSSIIVAHTESRSHHPSNRYFMQAPQTTSWCWRFSLKVVIMFTMSSFKECNTRRLFTGTFFTICRKLSTVKILTFWNLKNKLLQITTHMVSFGTRESDQDLFQCTSTTFRSSPWQLLFLEGKSPCKSAEATKL